MKLGIQDINASMLTLNKSMIYLVITNHFLVCGVMLYFISFILWLYVLSGVRLNYAYPLISLSYPIVVVLSYFLLNEPISRELWIGIILILIGTWVVGVYSN
jgi:drug/metabolite transporter (DMT)-like permease